MNDEITDVAGDSKAPAVERTGASPEAIISHYDKGEDFFKLVLGPELIYSCALFEGDNDLAEAKRRKPPTQNACSTLGADGGPCFAALSITRRCHTLSD